MFAPFYFVFIPLVAALAAVVWVLFFRISHDPESDLHLHQKNLKSDLEKAQEMERQEEAQLARRAQPGTSTR